MASLRGSVLGRQSKLRHSSNAKETVTHATILEQLGPALLAGKLNKKGKVNKSFAERWCELRRTDEGAQIDYFKGKQGLWKGSIVFDAETEAAATLDEGLPAHCFEISTKKRQYILQASSEEDAALWLDEIGAVASAAKEEQTTDEPTPDADASDVAGVDPAPSPSRGIEEERVPLERDLWSGGQTAQLGWESYDSVRAELENAREDRRLLLKHTIEQAQLMDQVREVVLAMTKDEDSEVLMSGAARLMHLCGVDPDAAKVNPSVMLPTCDGDIQLDPNFDNIAVDSLLLNLSSKPPVQCKLDDDQKFAHRPLEGIERLPSVPKLIAMDELASNGGDEDNQLASLCTIPEFRQAFSSEQMLLAGYEALLCCTVIKAPDFAKRLAEDALAKQRFEEAGQQVLAAEQTLADLSAADEPDDEAITAAAAVLEKKKEAVAAASDAEATPEPPEVLVARAEAQDYVETVLRPQFSLTSRAHRELVQALAVSSGDNDEACVVSPVGVGVPKDQLTPSNVLQWRWRCVRFRRPPADLVTGDEVFRSFKAFRSWVIRQLAMVLSGLILHLQTHDDHVWETVEGISIDDSRGSADTASQAFSSEDMISLLVAAARLIARKLDYASEFNLEDYSRAVDKMSALVMTVLVQKGKDHTADAGLDPWTSFVPLNCMLYEKLLSVCMSFNRNDSSVAGGVDDSLLEDEDEDSSDVNSAAVVNCLKQTWQPLRLSQAYHATLVVKNALNAFRKQPGKDVLVLLLDSVPDLKPIALGSENYTSDEIETTRAAFRELKTYCRSQLSDLFKHFDLEQTEEVTVLSQLYFHTTIVPDAGESWGDTALDPDLALTEAIQESVKAYYSRCKFEAENDSDDEYEEDEESKFIKLTLLAEKLDDDLDQRIFSTLARCVEFPPVDGVPAAPQDDAEALQPSKEIDPTRDSLDIALQQLVQNARIDCANVIASAHVDRSMAPCMMAMSRLDERLVELRQDTWLGEQEIRDGVDPPHSLLRLDALTAPVVGPWLEEQKEDWGEWVTRSLKNEKWVPAANGDKVDGVPVASSAVDMYSIVTAAMMNFEDSGMHGATSAKLREQFATAIVNTMETYVNEIEKSLGHMPRLEGSSKGKPVAPGRIKLDKKLPKKPREETAFKGTIEVYLRSVTLDEIIVRLNSLHYVQTHVLETAASRQAAKERQDAEKAVDGTQPSRSRRGRYSMAPPAKEKPVFQEFVTKDGAGRELGLLTATLEQALRSVREYLSAKVVLYDQRKKILDGLYVGYPANANAHGTGMELDMDDLDDIMSTIMSNVVEGQRDSTCKELYRRFLESLEYVVLSHDEYRIYNQNLTFQVNADIDKLIDFFHCDGDGLSMEELQQMKMDLDAILTLCSWPSETLTEKYVEFRQQEDELGSFNSRGGMGMYHLRRSDAIALILSHRRDDPAVQFFKKTVAEVKKGVKKMKKGTEGVGLEDQRKIDAANLTLDKLHNPIKAGWMYKEGHRRKTFKKRYFVVWPRDYRERTLDAPVLFYYDSDADGQKPKGTVSLANLKCRLPKSERKIKDDGGKEIGDCAFRADIDGAPEGHNKFIFATETTEELIPWMEVLESASAHEDALGKQLRDRRQTGVGRRRESVVAQMSEGTPPPSGRTSAGGIDHAQLAQLASLEEEDDGAEIEQ